VPLEEMNNLSQFLSIECEVDSAISIGTIFYSQLSFDF